MKLELLRKAFACLVLVGNLAFAQVCAVCNPVVDDGSPVNDACTTVIVTWGGSLSGECKLNPPPKCVARANCLFSVTIQIVDHGCGVLYSQSYCTQHVDAAGHPVGSPACAAESFLFANPSSVTDYPVVCGKQDSWVFRRYYGNQPVQIIAAPSGTCSACPQNFVPAGG